MSPSMCIPSGEWVIIFRHKVFTSYFKSMQFRILLCFLVLGLLPMVAVEQGFLMNYTKRAVSVRSTEVQNQCKILSNQLISSSYMRERSSELVDGELTQLSNLYDGRILIIDQDFRIIKDTYGLEENKIMVAEEVVKCFKGENTSHLVGNRFLEMTVPIQENDSKTIVGVILISASTDSIRDNREYLEHNANMILVALAVILLSLSVLCSYLLVRPIRNMGNYLQEFAVGHDDQDMEISSYAETVKVSRTFNRIISQMRVLDESRQEFVSNVSHELKTPLASMKVLADSLVMQEGAPLELYQEFMGDIAKEIERENKIITDLLSLVKMDKKAADLNIEPVSINDLLELILKRLRPIANRKNIEVVLESFRPVIAEIDEVKLTLAFTNLVENAIKYNHENGWVHVSLDADHKFFYVKVMDSGIGIPEESKQHIFERFYRVDKSHSNTIDGTGLGLAITRSAILLHKGAIKVSSVLEEGTTFSVRIPLNFVG
ncbi:MAG: HAMP domain-containing histidine kinase [Lachnospiraceae bacterium]|nr:HAMP domain-containing histidine kinase [Lachnospiraceae bacterium]